eukprot:tig00021589_g22708.t1
MPCGCEGSCGGCGSVPATIRKSSGPDLEFFSPYITAYSTGAGSRHASRVRRGPQELESSGSRMTAWTKQNSIALGEQPAPLGNSESKDRYKWPKNRRNDFESTIAWREETGFSTGNQATLKPAAPEDAAKVIISAKNDADGWLQRYVSDSNARDTWKYWQQKERLGPVNTGFSTSLARQQYPSHNKLEGQTTYHSAFRRPRFGGSDDLPVQVNHREDTGFSTGNASWVHPPSLGPTTTTEYKDRYVECLGSPLPDGVFLERGGANSAYTHPLRREVRATTAPTGVSEMRDAFRKKFAPAFENIPKGTRRELSGFSLEAPSGCLPRGVETSVLPPRKEVLENCHPSVARVLLSRCHDNFAPGDDTETVCTDQPRLCAFATLCIDDADSAVAMVLGHSIRESRSAHPSVALIGPGVSETSARDLARAFDRVVAVDPVFLFAPNGTIETEAGPHPLNEPAWALLRVYQFTEYYKVFFLGSDALLLANVDDVFELDPPAAAYDPWLWETSVLGTTAHHEVLLVAPSERTFRAITALGRSLEAARRDPRCGPALVPRFEEAASTATPDDPGTDRLPKCAETIAAPKTWIHWSERCKSATVMYLGPFLQSLVNRFYNLSLTILPPAYNTMPHLLASELRADRRWLWDPAATRILHYEIYRPWDTDRGPHAALASAFGPWLRARDQMRAALFGEVSRAT